MLRQHSEPHQLHENHDEIQHRHLPLTHAPRAPSLRVLHWHRPRLPRWRGGEGRARMSGLGQEARSDNATSVRVIMMIVFGL